MQYTESSRGQVKRVLRAATLCYKGLYAANPFAAFDYAATLQPKVRALVESDVPLEVRHDWPLSERLELGKESVPVMWSLDPRRLPA